MTTTLTKTETTLLAQAAERGGEFAFPPTMKPSSAQRLLGRLVRDGLIAPGPGEAAEASPRLTKAGYGAVGLTPPRRTRAAGTGAPAGSKRDLVLALLGREEGASLAELVAATGWLSHTTRAALSRLRSAGQALLRSTRQDGCTAYRIQPTEPKPSRATRTRPAEAGAAAV